MVGPLKVYSWLILLGIIYKIYYTNCKKINLISPKACNFVHETKENSPKRSATESIRVELESIIDPGHALVKLAKVVEWDRLDELFGSTYCPEKGRPGVSTRLMNLKYTYNLSDDVVEGWVESSTSVR